MARKPKLLRWVKDTTAPTLTTVTFVSDNTTTTLAKTWDTVTLAFVPSEAIYNIAVTIAWHNVTPTQIDPLSYTVDYTLVAWDTEWSIPITIDFKDVNWVSWTQVVATTWWEIVTFDKTAPTATLTYSIDWGSNYTSTARVNDADTLRIKAVFSEAVKDTPVPKIAIDNAVLSATNMTKTNSTTYYYDLNVPTGDFTATCTLSVAVDLAWNVITAAPTNATFVVDNTVPTLASATRVWNTSLDVVLSQAALTSTITKANDWGFVVSETWTPATTYAVSSIAPWVDDTHVVLTVANMLVSAKEWVTVTYTAWWNGTVSDVAGNALATDATWVAVTAWDTTWPTMSSVSRQSNTVIFVTLSENADDATLTQANDGWFTVAETWTPLTTYAVSATAKQWSNSNIVELTVADMTASAIPWVTVTYSSAGNWIITDVAGNDMATDAVWKATWTWA
jgi:large repetitive protein